jgi:hypothetical protein
VESERRAFWVQGAVNVKEWEQEAPWESSFLFEYLEDNLF